MTCTNVTTFNEITRWVIKYEYVHFSQTYDAKSLMVWCSISAAWSICSHHQNIFKRIIFQMLFTFHISRDVFYFTLVHIAFLPSIIVWMSQKKKAMKRSDKFIITHCKIFCYWLIYESFICLYFCRHCILLHEEE